MSNVIDVAITNVIRKGLPLYYYPNLKLILFIQSDIVHLNGIVYLGQ